MSLTRNQSVDLTSCDKEPIHIPGSVQPHGVVMALHPETLRVLQVSTNTVEMFGVEAEWLLGKTLAEFLEHGDSVALTQMVKGMSGTVVRAERVRAPMTGRLFRASAHQFDSVLMLELESADPVGEFSFSDAYPRVVVLPDLLAQETTLERVGELTAQEIQRLGRFDRVLVMKFSADWAGHVIAEAKVDEVSSFLDIWFPASDIPAQARKLYEITRLRMIADSGARAVPLMPIDNPLTGRPLDMSPVVLRSVSPVHLEYMRNMGVGASLSLSLLGPDGRLWGMIVCHRSIARPVPADLRMACALMARMLASQIEKVEVLEHRAVIEREILLRSLATRLIGFLADEKDFVDGLTQNPEELIEFAQASGVAILNGERCAALGQCPDEKSIWAIVNWLHEAGHDDLFETDRAAEKLGNIDGLVARASGILAMGVSKPVQGHVIWFRPEIVRAVKWGGDPRKPAEPGAQALHPRKSFEVWQEMIRGRSRAWSESEMDAAFLLRETVSGVGLV